MADGDVVGVAIGIDHPEIQHLNGAAARIQADGIKAPLLAPDRQYVTVDPEADFLASQLDPLASIPSLPSLASFTSLESLGKCVSRKYARQRQRTSHCRDSVSQTHPFLLWPIHPREVSVPASRHENDRHLTVVLKRVAVRRPHCEQAFHLIAATRCDYDFFVAGTGMPAIFTLNMPKLVRVQK